MDVTNTTYPENTGRSVISRRRRIVWYWKFSEAVSAAADFCQAGMLYRPTTRAGCRGAEADYAYQMLKNTGHEEISLSSLSSSDYSQLKELVTFLIDEFKDQGDQYILAFSSYRCIFAGCNEHRCRISVRAA